MKSRPFTHAITLISCSVLLVTGLARGNWPEFGGPNANFKVDGPALADSWAEGKPQELWRLSVGEGFGSAAIADGKAYIFDRIPGDSNAIRCLDLANGEEVWRFQEEARGRVGYPGSRAVPTVTEEHVYAVGPMGNVYCVSRTSGSLVWKLNMAEDFSGNVPRFGYANSPLIIDDKIIVTPQGSENSIAALNAKTGEKLWSVGGITGNAHSSPVYQKFLGEDYIIWNGSDGGTGNIVGIDAETGEVGWRYTGYQIFLAIPAPIVIGDDLLLISGGYGAGMQLLKGRSGENGVSFTKVWSADIQTKIHRPIIDGDHIYAVANDNQQAGGGGRSRRRSRGGSSNGLICLDMKGNSVWKTDTDPYFGFGGLVQVGDKFIVQDGQNGIIRLVQVSSEGYKELGIYDAFGQNDGKDHQMWAPLAISGDTLLIRSQNEFVCLKLPLAK